MGQRAGGLINNTTTESQVLSETAVYTRRSMSREKCGDFFFHLAAAAHVYMDPPEAPRSVFGGKKAAQCKREKRNQDHPEAVTHG